MTGMTGITTSAAPAFGVGGSEPYERVLRGVASALTLRDASDGGPGIPLDVGRFLGEPDAVERRLVRAHRGPLLDIGCGPGRMLRAALRARRPALGIDISPASVALAASRGLIAMHGSVFEAVPAEGAWTTALLLDGNIGIGGDPERLLARCAELLHPAGAVLVEAHPDAGRDIRFDGFVVDDSGASSGTFPWAEAGAGALRRHARSAGLTCRREWRAGRRHFAEYSL
jgi:SAM-dependent methyltransferase